jgi:hypothetical protein
MKKNNILIIGSSNSIKKIFTYKYKDLSNIDHVNFRYVWCHLKKINKYDEIIISGFHYYICYCSVNDLKIYIAKYIKFINFLCKKSKKTTLISTYIDEKLSLSRVVYFYYNLIKRIKVNSFLNEKIHIISFRKIYFSYSIYAFDKFLKKILESSLFNFINYEFLIKNMNNYKINHLSNIKFLFIKLPRPRFVDRILRLF